MQLRLDLRREGDVFKQLRERAKQAKPILRRWGGYLRKKAAKRIDSAEGMPPLAESTRKKYEQTRTAAVTVQGKARKSHLEALERRLRKTPDAQAELWRIRAGGSLDASASLITNDKRRKKLAVDRLRRQLLAAQTGNKRVGGDARKSDKSKLLGRLRGAFSVALKGLAVIVKNKAKFSKIHNEGGIAGHNARIPERSFLFFDRDDLRELAKIAVEHFAGRKH